jgi:hypothetical protein
MHVGRSLHVIQYPLLEIRHRAQGVRHVLILLYVSNDFGGLGSFREVDQLCVLNNGCDAVFDERQICQIDAYVQLVSVTWMLRSQPYPGMEYKADWQRGASRGIGRSSSCLPSAAALTQA